MPVDVVPYVIAAPAKVRSKVWNFPLEGGFVVVKVLLFVGVLWLLALPLRDVGGDVGLLLRVSLLLLLGASLGLLVVLEGAG